MPRLRWEEVVTIRVLAEKGQNHCEIARTVGVTEGAVRYHLRRAVEGAEDGRKDKPFRAECVAEVIAAWHAEPKDRPEEEPRPVNVQELYEHLVAEHEYAGSYDSVLRYVRSKYPKPKIRTYRRVETPPGAQAQSDWGEFPRVAIGDDVAHLSAFVMTLSHSRKPAVVWSEDKGLLSWLGCHNGAFHRLAGVAAVNRIDNVKTALSSGAGARGVIHPAYQAYARSVGFHVDACEPGHKEGKGKVEAKVRFSRLRLDPYRRRWDSLEELQAWTDERIERWAERATCPATGQSVAESWEAELAKLSPLPLLPEPFDVAVTRPVHKDCMVRFEQRSYAVPFAWVGQRVEVRGCARTVQILADGRVLCEYPRRTSARVLIDPSCYEGEATDRVLPPRPLGKMGRRLQEIWEMPVEQRPLDLYQALAGVAR
jgi:transposase